MEKYSAQENEASTTSTPSASSDADPGGYPGDGVCPPVSFLQTVFRSAYDNWVAPASQTVPDGRSDLFCLNMFLQLMKTIPPFRPPPLKDTIALEAIHTDLIADLDMLLETCMLQRCEQREKSVPYHLLIGRSIWNTYREVSPFDQNKLAQLTLPLSSLKSLKRLVLAWSYVLCCRWVEILQGSGEKAVLQHPPTDVANDFWEIVHGEQWQAIVEHEGRIYYAPFMLRNNLDFDTSIEYSAISQPRSAHAFRFIEEYCKPRDLLHECAIALVIVMSLITHHRPPLQLLEWSSDVETADSPSCSSDQYEHLWNLLDRCITMGCTLDAVDSLLCSAFFNPAVPCNAVGAQLTGIQNALDIETQGYGTLISGIRKYRPCIAAFWLGVIATGQARRAINFALSPIPQVNLVVGAWTGLVQSFLQVQYDGSVDTNPTISRASELATAYYVQPEINQPLCRTPPFGRTRTENTTLPIREHLEHSHRPQKARFNWRLNNGQVAEAHDTISVTFPVVDLLLPEMVDFEPSSNTADWREAMEISSIATSYIFSWHCQHNDGLWLDEGDGSQTVRKIQNHPWIKTSLFDESESDEEETPSRSATDFTKITAWRDGSLEMRGVWLSRARIRSSSSSIHVETQNWESYRELPTPSTPSYPDGS